MRRTAVLIGLGLGLWCAAARAAYSPAASNGWILTAGRVQGFAGGLFRTDVWLFNPEVSSSATVTLVLHPQVSPGQPAAAEIRSSPITLGPRETRLLADATLSTVPAGEGVVGSLEWESDRPILVSARIYTAALAGTFGYSLAGIPTSESLPVKQSASDSANVLQLYGTSSGDENFRTNLDVANTSPVAVTLEVRVIDPVTSDIYGGTQEYALAAGSLLRLLDVLGAESVPVRDGLRITVAIREGTALPSGGILAVATTLDNRTNDGYAFVGQRQSESIVPASLLPAFSRP